MNMGALEVKKGPIQCRIGLVRLGIYRFEQTKKWKLRMNKERVNLLFLMLLLFVVCCLLKMFRSLGPFLAFQEYCIMAGNMVNTSYVQRLQHLSVVRGPFFSKAKGIFLFGAKTNNTAQ
jgi:hypothetical protein